MTRAFNIDCMEAMAQMKDNEFSLALVDPPYGISDTWNKSRRDRFYKKCKLSSYQNNEIPSEEYFNQLIRVSKNQIIWGANYYTEFLRPTNAWIIWDKKIDSSSTFMSEAEMAWTSFKKVTRIAEFMWSGVLKCEKTTKVHPHQKPVALYKWILKKYAKEGNTILDTHLGSQSSRIAAHDMGFDFTGYEIDADYFNSGEKRFQNHIRQQSLFKPKEMY